jgi:tetratricopeptide (TPR) repeat protein
MMDGHAEDEGRVYQASGDQHISEHHYHGTPRPEAGGPDSVRRPAVGRPPVVLRDRDEVMAQLRESLAPGRGGEVYVLHGLGGSGKTAVACEIFQVAVDELGRVGLWVNAADRASLRAGMLAVAAERGADDNELLGARNGHRPAADLVWDYLDRSPEPWLLVLDNADDPSLLRDGSWLRTSPRGVVAVTTRQSAVRWWPGAQLQHIGVLPRADAARVLHDLAPESGTLEQAADVADRLGRLPLALTLAGGFLAHQVIDPWTMDTYGRHLDDEGQVDLIDQGAEVLAEQDPRQLVGRTWQLTLDSFAARGRPEAVALLRLLARLAPEPLPLSVLNRDEIERVLPRARCETALRVLIDHSLVEVVDVGPRSAQAHGVLLASVAAATPAEQVAALDETAARLLDAAVPALPDAGPLDPRLRLLTPHALALLRRVADPVAVADVLAVTTRLAIALHRTGDYMSGWEAARAAAALAERTLGSEHRLVLAAYSRAGRGLFRMGRYAEAAELHRRVLDTQERLFGAADPDTLHSAHGLQMVLGNIAGGRAEAQALRQFAVAGREAALGPAHPLTLRSKCSQLAFMPAAELASEDGQSLLSLPEECARHLGSDHTVTLTARLDRARALRELGRSAEADAEAGGVLADYQRRFGPEYPVVLAAQQLYATTQAAVGRLDSAIELLTDVVERRERGLGADHHFTVHCRGVLDRLLAERREVPPPTSG